MSVIVTSVRQIYQKAVDQEDPPAGDSGEKREKDSTSGSNVSGNSSDE